ncbi:MAG: PilZ domain-containing protein [Candidatus Omnitrophota bacterium]
MYSFNEKRKHQRVNVSSPLRYKEFYGNDLSTRGSLTKNLSKGGVRFNCDKFVPLSCHLTIEINLNKLSKPVKAVSKVAWIKKLPAGDNYEIGSEFLAVTKEDNAMISNYMDAAYDEAVI